MASRQDEAIAGNELLTFDEALDGTGTHHAGKGPARESEGTLVASGREQHGACLHDLAARGTLYPDFVPGIEVRARSIGRSAHDAEHRRSKPPIDSVTIFDRMQSGFRVRIKPALQPSIDRECPRGLAQELPARPRLFIDDGQIHAEFPH